MIIDFLIVFVFFCFVALSVAALYYALSWNPARKHKKEKEEITAPNYVIHQVLDE